MKKLLIIFGFALAMIACAGNSTKTVENTSDSDTIVVDSVIDFTSVDTICID